MHQQNEGVTISLIVNGTINNKFIIFIIVIIHPYENSTL
jgi:hypothetical protein